MSGCTPSYSHLEILFPTKMIQFLFKPLFSTMVGRLDEVETKDRAERKILSPRNLNSNVLTFSGVYGQKRQTCCKLLILPPFWNLSTSWNKLVNIVAKLLVATYHLQTCYNLLKQLAESLWITSFYNQLATSLLTTCNRLVVKSCRKPYERILISACW